MDIMNRDSAILILVGLMEELGLLMAMAGDVKENMTSLMSREYNIKTSLAEIFCRFGITALTVAINKGLELLRDPLRGGVAAVGVSHEYHQH